MIFTPARAGRPFALLLTALLGCGGVRAGDAPSGNPDTRPPRTDTAPAVRTLPAWFEDAVAYQVFVRSFRDSNGDGVGDLAGLRGSLDHLQDGAPGGEDLGVNVLILMPIFPSVAYHGFDPMDFRAVSADYGTLADLDALVADAHARGMRVILDLPLNATSARHPWFHRAWEDTSRHHDWYRFRDTNPGWTRPGEIAPQPVWFAIGDSTYYYAIRSPGQPDLALENPVVLEELRETMAFWTDRGIDGFRVDVIRYLVEVSGGAGQQDVPASHEVLATLRRALADVAPDAVLLGDAAGEVAELVPYVGLSGGPPECDAITSRALTERILRSVRRGTSAALGVVLEQLATDLPAGASFTPALGHHDEQRIATHLADPVHRRGAAAVLLTLPGVPMLYYGEELGMRDGDAPVGLAGRLPMAWAPEGPAHGFSTATPWAPLPPGAESANVETQRADPASLLQHYRRWIDVRAASPALRTGRLRLLSETGGRASVLCFLRERGAERVLVAHNLSDRPQALDVPVAGVPGAALAAAETVPVPVADGGVWRVTLPPRESAVWAVEGGASAR